MREDQWEVQGALRLDCGYPKRWLIVSEGRALIFSEYC